MKWLKGLKWWIAGLIAGQALWLFASKPGLKHKLAQAQWTDKIKLVFDELVSFNKWLIESIDLSNLKSDLAFRIEHLQEDITDLTTNWSELSQEKLEQWANYLQSTTDQLKTDVTSYVQDLDEQHSLTEKLSALGEHITQIKSNITGMVSEAKQDVKDTKNEVKSATKDVVTEVKHDAKHVAAQVKSHAKEVGKEIKETADHAKQNAQIIKKNIENTDSSRTRK